MKQNRMSMMMPCAYTCYMRKGCCALFFRRNL